MKFKHLLLPSILLSAVAVNAVADQPAPQCPSLSSFSNPKILGNFVDLTAPEKSIWANGNSFVNFPSSSNIIDSEMISLTKLALSQTTVSGNATKVPTNKGAYFYACASFLNNYHNIPQKVSKQISDILITTPTFGGPQISAQQKMAFVKARG